MQSSSPSGRLEAQVPAKAQARSSSPSLRCCCGVSSSHDVVCRLLNRLKRFTLAATHCTPPTRALRSSPSPLLSPIMQRQRQLHSYSSSSASSASSPDDYADSSYGPSSTEGLPPSSLPLFRRNSSLESTHNGYESPEPDEEIEDETHSHAVAQHVETLSLGGTGCMRTPRTLLPRSICEEDPGEESSRDAAPPLPVYADVAMARTRSMPLPRHEARGPLSAMASPASAVSPSSSSHLPVSQPGFGSSQSWTPGQAPPAPYTAITPLSPHLEEPDDRFDFQLEGGPMSFAPLVPPHAADADDLPPMFGDGADFESLSRAPPPSRNPSLLRQKGVYNESTSRAISMPSGARALLQQRLARQVREQEEQRSQPQLHLQVAAPPYPARRYDDDDPDILPPHNPQHR